MDHGAFHGALHADEGLFLSGLFVLAFETEAEAQEICDELRDTERAEVEFYDWYSCQNGGDDEDDE